MEKLRSNISISGRMKAPNVRKILQHLIISGTKAPKVGSNQLKIFNSGNLYVMLNEANVKIGKIYFKQISYANFFQFKIFFQNLFDDLKE